MDDIDRMLEEAGIPLAYRPHLRKQMIAQIQEHGHAGLRIPATRPMDATMMPPLPPHMMLDTPDAQMIYDAQHESGQDPMTLGDEYTQDMRMLGDTIQLVTLLETGTEFEKDKLLPQIQRLRQLMGENMLARSEDAIASIQQQEHARKVDNSMQSFKRWQDAVTTGDTRLGYDAWLTTPTKGHEGTPDDEDDDDDFNFEEEDL